MFPNLLAIDTCAAPAVIMHDALKGPRIWKKKKKSLLQSQTPRAEFSELTQWVPRERHENSSSKAL